MPGQGVVSHVLHAVRVEIDRPRGVFRIRAVAIGELMVDDFVAESGEFDLDQARDVVGERRPCNVGFVRSRGRLHSVTLYV